MRNSISSSDRSKRCGVTPRLAIAGLCSLTSLALPADTLTGSSRILCSAVEANVCTADGICESFLPWSLQIPQFLRIDLERKQLATTEASGENRRSPIAHLTRESGRISVQGAERGRAFSMVLREEDGLASIAIATDAITISVFAACTPDI